MGFKQLGIWNWLQLAHKTHRYQSTPHFKKKTSKVAIELPCFPFQFSHPKTPIIPGEYLQAALFQWQCFFRTGESYTSTRWADKFGEAEILSLRSSSIPAKDNFLPHRHTYVEPAVNVARNLNIQLQKIHAFESKAQLKSYMNHSH